MKFRNFGKALLMSALSVGAILSVTSCVQSYTVGFLYVTGTQTSGSSGQGIISGFKIDHNTGKLTPVNGMPVSSGGANPVRVELTLGSRFLYVLNKGVDANGGSDCTSATAPCNGSSIVQYTVGGNGSLVQQQTFYTQGLNPFRMFADATGSHLYVLDHDSPSASACALALGPSAVSCGDITAFNIDATTGRLSLLQNAQVTTASGSPLPYFPVPANPIDMLLSSSFVFTLSGTPTTGDVVFPYSVGTNGQLTISQNSVQTLNIFQGTAIQAANGSVYVLDNEPITYTPSGSSSPVTAPSQILPFTIGSGGALQAAVGGIVPNDPTMSDPLFLKAETGNAAKWVYVANFGNNADPNAPQSGITGYVIDTTTKQLTPMSGSPFASPTGSGGGPQCLVEDPSNQFIYTANFNDSTVTGHSIDRNTGVLRALPGAANKAYGLPGPASYCVVNGRTS